MRSGESRISRGWRLTGAAWRLMRQDPTMIGLAFLGTGCGLLGAALMLYLGGVFSPAHYSRAHFGLIALLFLYPLTFVGVFFNVALTAAAVATLEGRWIGVGGALREAWDRVDRIAQWALLSAVVGFVINQIASRVPAAGRIVAWLIGVAWGIATLFAIPLLTLEDAGPVEAARGSAHLVRSTWGEGLTGIVSISVWASIAMIPVVIGGIAGFAVAKNDPAVGIGLIVVSVTAFVSIVAAVNATRQVFNLALFRYATGVSTPGFDVADFEDPFARKEGRRRTRSWAWIALALIVGLIAIGLIFGHHRRQETGSDSSGSYWHVTLPAAASGKVSAGMPVYFGGRQVGVVAESRLEAGQVVLAYTVDPRIPYSSMGRVELDVHGPRPALNILPAR
ncbi:MAG: DUF6159 family protein [Solirubrobacterales bacterium]